MKVLKFNKKFDDVSISENIRNFDDFNDFCCPEFDSFFRDLAIFRLKSNKQYYSIPKSQKNLLAKFSSRNKTWFTNICKTFDIAVDKTLMTS